MCALCYHKMCPQCRGGGGGGGGRAVAGSYFGLLEGGYDEGIWEALVGRVLVSEAV
jgi:hypothetical protein